MKRTLGPTKTLPRVSEDSLLQNWQKLHPQSRSADLLRLLPPLRRHAQQLRHCSALRPCRPLRQNLKHDRRPPRQRPVRSALLPVPLLRFKSRNRAKAQPRRPDQPPPPRPVNLIRDKHAQINLNLVKLNPVRLSLKTRPPQPEQLRVQMSRVLYWMKVSGQKQRRQCQTIKWQVPIKSTKNR